MSALQDAVAVAELRYAMEPWERHVMVKFSAHPRRPVRHLKLYRDERGLYVIMGFYGKRRRYLDEMGDGRVLSHVQTLAIFYEVK
jgi:hypothetical protein